MNASRTAARIARGVRTTPLRANLRHARFQSSSSSASTETAAKTGASSGVVGGIAGGALVFAAGYGYYYMSGAKSVVDAASITKSKLNKITASIQDSAPEPNELLKWFRGTATSYAAFIPGAKSYVDTAFNDLDKIEQKHRGELNDIISKAHSDLKEVSKNGLTVETAQKTWEVLEKSLKQLGELASDSASDILDNHPELKDKVGGDLDQLKSMANSYGPEAKKELDQTYSQIKEALAGGVGVGTVDKIQNIVQEKVDKIKQLSDEAWKKGMEQAKPYLDKNPRIKELIEENKDALKSGNVGELYEKVKEGNADSINEYVQQATEKAQNSGLGKSMEKYMKMIPGGDKIIPKLTQLQEVTKKHGDEAQKILKETYDEISDILEKKTKDVENLADKAKKDAKKQSR